MAGNCLVLFQVTGTSSSVSDAGGPLRRWAQYDDAVLSVAGANLPVC